ncbi:MAG: HAD-IA family hydrolase [Dehalococcoidales bacterium]|nr:MAG: HAD-IA family hydrolase [Dehalococcoidales bacterium]
MSVYLENTQNNSDVIVASVFIYLDPDITIKYKAIIFDLFGTLVENLLSHQYREMLVEITNILSLEQERFINLWLEYSEERMTGHISNANCLATVCRKFGLEITEDLSNNCMNVFTDCVRLRLEPPTTTLTALSDLRERGYTIGLTSNCSDEVPFLWDNSPLSEIIPDPVFSCSVGFQKPDRQIYQIAAEKMNTNPGECLFVDDNAEYLTGAMDAGMTGVLIQDRTLNSSISNVKKSTGYKIASLREMGALIANIKLH